MGLEDITDPAAVQKAIAEFRQLGQTAFLDKYGFGTSRGWLLLDRGEEFDAKAILGAAHAYQYPKSGSLPYDEFHGGQPTARKLRMLGFTVREPLTHRNPTWTRDELILALELYMRHRPHFPDDRHPEVVNLSRLLNKLGQSTSASGAGSYRNSNGVAMKLQNFRRLDPEQEGKGLPAGGKTEMEVWNAFAKDPGRLRATAAAIKAAIEELQDNWDQQPDDGEEAEEGKILTRLHRTRERDRRIVDRRKAQALKREGVLRCEACTFDFGKFYSERGSGFIECHHTKPVSSLVPGEKTRLQDLVLLCANCHRMVHVRRPWLTVEQLKSVLANSA
jgi:5-methylcytosine-specific restriction protein A